VKVVYYAESTAPPALRIAMVIEAMAPGHAIRYHNLWSFVGFLGRGPDREKVAVLLLDGEEQLLCIYAIKHILWRIPFLLVLPDREKETRALGLRLRPHALCYIDSQASVVRAAFEHTIRNAGRLCIGMEDVFEDCQDATAGVPGISISDRAA
jgi:hypothetical protein